MKEDITQQHKYELNTFLLTIFVLAPLIGIIGLGGYGLIFWIIEIFTMPLLEG